MNRIRYALDMSGRMLSPPLRYIVFAMSVPRAFTILGDAVGGSRCFGVCCAWRVSGACFSCGKDGAFGDRG